MGATLGGGDIFVDDPAGGVSHGGASASCSDTILGAGAGGAGAWWGGGGGEGAGRGRGEVASAGMDTDGFASPPPSLEQSLATRLEVVDYVLRRPFSDDTLRSLLGATAADYRRVRVDGVFWHQYHRRIC